MFRLKSLYSRIMSTNAGKWAVVGSLIGVVAGIGAIILYLLINLVTEYLLTELTGFSPPRSGIVSGIAPYHFSPYRSWMIPVSLVVGGLLVAIILNKTAPEAKGHGTDAAIDAFHNKNGRIRRRIPIVKTIASALTIGSGGSAGREGPTAQIAAGFGSFIADIFHLNDHDRRIATASGIGAGIGSIFLAPLGGAILSTEILYKKDFEVEALIPSTIASVVGYSIFGYYTGYKTIFSIPPDTVIGFFHPESLLVYLIIGMITGLAAILYIKLFYGISGIFEKMKRLNPYLKPAIGGLFVGIIAIFFPQILGLGYGWVQQILDGNLTLFGQNQVNVFLLLFLLFVLKLVATALSIGSEGSGGVFAPGMVSGAFLGAALGIPIHAMLPFISEDEVVIVSMISMFGGASKAPIAIIIMGTEMTGTYALFIPLMLATTVSYFVSGNNTIYRSQVLDRSQSPAHADEYKKPILDEIPIYTAMKRDYIYVSKNASIKEGVSKIRESRTKGIVVEDNHILEGYLSIENIPSNVNYDDPVEKVMNENIPTIGKSESLHSALNRLISEPTGKLVVIEDENSKSVCGTITLTEISEAYNREIRRIKEANRVLNTGIR